MPPSPPPAPCRTSDNKLLATLGDLASQHFCSQLERVTLIQGQVIYEPDAVIKYVYFPETAVFSMLSITANGETVEVGPVGDEGMVGLRIFLGAVTSPERVIVHVAGSALRAEANALGRELSRAESKLQRLLLRYTQMLLAMTSRSSACNKLHKLELQLARWLLTMHDYIRDDQLRLTHELIALTLGVRRAGISDAAAALRKAGVITYLRRDIQIHDREGLEARACDCYGVIKGEYDRLYADLSKARKVDRGGS